MIDKFPFRFWRWSNYNVRNGTTSQIWDSQQIATNWDIYSLVCIDSIVHVMCF